MRRLKELFQALRRIRTGDRRIPDHEARKARYDGEAVAATAAYRFIK